MSTSFWSSQSAVTDPGNDSKILAALDALPSDIPSLRDAASELILHYRGRASEVIPSRQHEIHTCFADAMLSRVLSRGEPATLDRHRSSDDRTVGCCRDSVVLFLSLLRYKGIPARERVGFASYFREGWMMDHVVAEVWDAQESRWRIVDPDPSSAWVRKVNSEVISWADLRLDIDFQAGPDAWRAARADHIDPSKYVVAPELHVEGLRGMPYIAHNVILDLAGMNKQEMLLWHSWGLDLDMEISVPEKHLEMLDSISALLVNRQIDSKVVAELMAKEQLAIPKKVMRYDPYASNEAPKLEDVSRILGFS